MDVLTSETRWAVDNKASVIKLVNLYSNIKMMHGPIRIRMYSYFFLKSVKEKNPNKPPSNWFVQRENKGIFTSFCCKDWCITCEYCGFSQSNKICMAGHCLITLPEMHTLLAFLPGASKWRCTEGDITQVSVESDTCSSDTLWNTITRHSLSHSDFCISVTTTMNLTELMQNMTECGKGKLEMIHKLNITAQPNN